MCPRLARRPEIEPQMPGQQGKGHGIGVLAGKRETAFGVLHRGGQAARLAQALGGRPVG